MERKAISKKLRFDVFKRDSFTCQYCGATPPKVVLELDHIHPVFQGGKDTLHNLITACFDCNRGKGAGLLTTLPESLTARAELIAEKMEQLKAYERLLKSKRKHEEKQIDQIEETFSEYFKDQCFTDKFRESVRRFLQDIDCFQLISHMHRACAKCYGPDKTLKYFCGICWNVIKGESR